MKALEFPTYLDWLNTDKAYSIQDFRGKIVLLNFWTYSSIKCLHVISDLKRFKNETPELVIVGVHSAKFEKERSTQNIKEAIIRHDIDYPVVNDYNHELLNGYGVKAWPSYVLIDPEGNVIGQTSGEGIYERVRPFIQRIRDKFKKKGNIHHERIQFVFEKNKRSQTTLSYPGKLEVDHQNKRLFIGDSHNHRIIITDDNGKVLDKIGNGNHGNKDGTFEDTAFNYPQGMVYDEANNFLYIADTQNHVVKVADLEHRTVKTIFGTGQQAHHGMERGVGTYLSINSPWDLELIGNELIVAMAGAHQLWRINTHTYKAYLIAGSGYEGVIDGEALDAHLAQPSSITKDGVNLYFADSETSSIRKLERSRVQTLIGKGVFIYGDIDGHYEEARLQHPLGVLYHKGKLYVADTYNNKIKVINQINSEIKTLIGTGENGILDGDIKSARLNEPSDIKYMDEKFYIADTNNNRIRVYNPESQRLITLELTNLEILENSSILSSK